MGLQTFQDSTREGTAESVSKITPSAVPSHNQIKITLSRGAVHLFSQLDLTESDFENLIGSKLLETEENLHHYSVPLNPVNAFVLRYALKGMKVTIDKNDGKILGEEADKIELPYTRLTDDKNHVEIIVPFLNTYRNLLKMVNAYPTKTGYRINLTRVLDLEALSETLDTKLPKIRFTKEVLQLNREPIIGYDGTLESLKDIPIASLNVIAANSQSVKALSNSKKTLNEKFESLGLKTLYDLLFWLPKRYIDKSEPQDIRYLVEGETATIIGKISEVQELTAGRGGVVFTIRTNEESHNGGKIQTTFFNQRWLMAKFNVGDEVLVNGKFAWWKGRPQISGSSIEHADEASVLPIVPVYRQSPTRGVTTYLILAAERELISRIGDIKLPPYLRQEGRMNYCEALTEVHMPSSLEKYREAVETLAYYELVHMQILVQETRDENSERVGIQIKGSPRKLQAKAIKTLPFDLTRSQKIAVVTLNKKMADIKPSTILLNAEVGSGKSIIAFLACLKAVDGGTQAVLIGPTDILARQLYEGLERLTSALDADGEHVRTAFFSGSMKAKEKKEILKDLEEGNIDIVVGTHSLMGDNVKYANLGFVAIDEQQKFGTEQRTKLLNSRKDGLVPDLLMQTATPIPRSTAQVFYGDIDMIELAEKPAGRLPIVTEWIHENPVDVISQTTNDMWIDVINEAKKGNQTFIIAPLVQESTKIDSASVERTFKNLSELALSSLNIGFVHGQMKSDLQKEEMRKFRDGEYDVLVASTVIEVGVDIPNATRVVVLSAERLGSSSLHQIRGRVGRNSKPSKCYLVSATENKSGEKRLQSLVDSNNGFEIAKADLELRGEGKLFNTEQSGSSEMIFASLSKHRHLIHDAQVEAQKILKSPFRDMAIKYSKEEFNTEKRMV